MPATSVLEQYRISDFLEWHDRGQLVLNPFFQRRNVWSAGAKIYLIDTILRRLPMPKLYLRTNIDAKTRTSFREVVDGQQRLRAIIDFAHDGFVLSSRAREFRQSRYSTLSPELQEEFLTYPIAVDQLINATDSDVLEVFARLNSYTATLRAAEKRHARFQGPFKWAVHEAAREWAALWERYGIVTVQERLRMADDSLMSEMFGVLLEGVTDGGSPRIDALYKRFDVDFPGELLTRQKLDTVLNYALEQFDGLLTDTPLARAPQFLMFFAALAHRLVGIPPGQVGAGFPATATSKAIDIPAARANLFDLASALDTDDNESSRFAAFVDASKLSTQRIATRRVRFLAYCDCLQSTT